MKQIEFDFIPEVGTLLMGGKRFSGKGVDEWFDFPRYRVVAIHMDDKQMFLECLNSNGIRSVDGYSVMPIDSDQWRYWREKCDDI